MKISRGRLRKNFFFEKKKQKTFVHGGEPEVQKGDWLPVVTDKSFLVLFFKKELLPSL
jgi:hypothetical protein